MTGKKRKAIIIANLITEKQKEELQEYCNNKDLEIMQIFDLFDSNLSITEDILEFLTSQQDKISVIAKTISELQKGISFIALPMINKLINQGNIELHFYNEDYIIDKNINRNEAKMFEWNIAVFFSKSYLKSELTVGK